MTATAKKTAAPKKAPVPKAKAAPKPKAAAASKSATGPTGPAGTAQKISRKDIEAAARAGRLPTAPDFSAETHARFRTQLNRLVGFVEAKDIPALKAEEIKLVSSSPKALDRYRNLAVMALEAQAAGSVEAV